MAFTENGAPSLATTQSARVNLFFKLNREKLEDSNHWLKPLIDQSWNESQVDTLRILFHARDPRGGKGERKLFIDAMEYICQMNYDSFSRNLKHIPTFGRWLDIVELHSRLIVAASSENACRACREIEELLANQLQTDHTTYITNETNPNISLLAKWFPGEGKKWDNTVLRKAICSKLFNSASKREFARLRKEYISPLRFHLSIVESQMCEKQWQKIDYSRVPSVAMNRLKKAFLKHDPSRFKEWIAEMKEKKGIHTDQLFPHEIIHQFLNHTHREDSDLKELLSLQWASIVDTHRPYFNEHTIALADVSGSMAGTPMEVSIALGLLVSTISGNPLITFSENPTLHNVDFNKTLEEQIESIAAMNWGQNTDFEKVMELLLTYLTEKDDNKKEEWTIFVFSDMQFDNAMFYNNVEKPQIYFERMKGKFAEKEIPFPRIIFWNLRGETSDFPCEESEMGVSLLSGYSPSLFKLFLSGEQLTPYTTMRLAIDAERYSSALF